MSKCLFCYLELTEGELDYHAHCARKFYGSSKAPALPYGFDELDALAQYSVELSVAVPGVQPKLSLGWIKTTLEDGHKGRLTIMDALEGLYILKPPNKDYDAMPENEHLTMKLAQMLGIDVVPFNMIRLKSGELCYITKRIDRRRDGRKIHMIDFLQILQVGDKYIGTMENLGKRIGDLSVNTNLDKLRFFELTVFNYIVGNNDMHLKNFSMLNSDLGWILSPAYDLLNVNLILPKDREEMALMLGGKKFNFKRNYFDQLAAGLLLDKKQLTKFYTRLDKWFLGTNELIERSFLSEEHKTYYYKLIATRIRLFLQ